MIVINGCSGDFILASVYLDIINLPAVPDWLDGLMAYSTAHPSAVLLAVDSNSHSTLYGPDQNSRGMDFEELIFRHGLRVENIGQTPTFQTSLCNSCIDVTLTRDSHAAVSTWRVDTRFNGSDHNTVLYDLQLGFEFVPSTRPWDRAK